MCKASIIFICALESLVSHAPPSLVSLRRLAAALCAGETISNVVN